MLVGHLDLLAEVRGILLEERELGCHLVTSSLGCGVRGLESKLGKIEADTVLAYVVLSSYEYDHLAKNAIKLTCSYIIISK